MPSFLDQRPDWAQNGFLADLARLELAMTEVFDEEECPVLAGEDLETLDPEQWETVRLEPIAALRLLSLEHVVVPHLKRPCPKPVKKPSWVAIYRRDYTVLRLELSRAEHDLLHDLVHGVPLGDALAPAMAGPGVARQQARVFSWFRTWIRGGLFQRLAIS